MLLTVSDSPGEPLGSGALVAVCLLGAFHGVNPGMGWLFAVSYGLQQRSRTALLKALVPIAAGHELSVLPTALVITTVASEVRRAVLLGVFTVLLVGFGVWLLLRKRHFRWVGMKLTVWQLAWWSFLMSTMTGAGLMLAPVLLSRDVAERDLLGGVLDSGLGVAGLLALAHALSMLLVAGAVALLVYHVFGLRILRTAWINLDRLWAFAFIVAGLSVWLV